MNTLACNLHGPDSMEGLDGLHWQSDGYASFSGGLLGRFREIDGLFADWAAGLGAVEYQFPSLISLKKLQPVRYLQSFPHLATLATTFRRDRETLAECAELNADSDTVALTDSHHEACSQLLTPAACYHFYPEFQGRTLRGSVRLTTRCNCHRRESNYEPLRRQWSFNMRELVCLGDEEATGWFVDDCRRRIEWLVDVLGLEAKWKVATDPFFDCDNDPKALAQLVAPVKQELCLPDGLAIASINEHRSFFGEAYDIRVGSEHARSVCVAFGLERWLWALADRFGKDPADWPDLGALA